MRSFFPRSLFALSALLAYPLSTLAAQDVPWKISGFYFSTKSAKVSDLLKELGSASQVPVVVSGQVNDLFSGSIRDASPGDVLDKLSSMFGLAWYYDRQAVYVYKQTEIKSAILTPRYLAVGQLSEYLRSEIGGGQNCLVRPISNLAALEVFGVPICVDRAVELSRELDEKVLNQAQNQEDVKVFKLLHASAADYSYSYRGQTVSVPGVVTVLRGMTQGKSVSVGASQPAVNVPGNVVPMFSADPRENAVVVRDKAANMPMYESLIKSLDNKARRIEISVMIVDVDSADLTSLGVSWQANVHIAGGGIALNSDDVNSQSGFSSVLSSTGQFLVKLDALAQQSKARIVSQPSVVTLDNVPAVLDKSTTFYTKLTAERYANLASVSSGSSLMVTPRIVDTNHGAEILLSLDIQDGRQGAPIGGAEQLPQVQNAEVSTQATLRPGESLLLGGFDESEESNGVRKIPFLGDIPLVGELFRSHTAVARKLTRLFLIKAVIQDEGQTARTDTPVAGQGASAVNSSDKSAVNSHVSP